MGKIKFTHHFYHNEFTTMKFKFASPILLMIICQNIFAQNIHHYNFTYVKDRIILTVETNKNDKINLLFDSASNDFLLDSAIAAKYDLIDLDTAPMKMSFVNGTSVFRKFTNKSLFKDTLLNKAYVFGKALRLKAMQEGLPIQINGVIGINPYLEKYVIGLNFEKEQLEISDKDPTYDKKTFSSELIFSDSDYGNQLSQYSHKLAAIKVRYILSNNVVINANALFDTGCNINFVVNSSSNIDSLLEAAKKAVTIVIKKVSLGNDELKIYKIVADSVVLNGEKSYNNSLIYFTKIPDNRMPEFGDAKSSGLIGAPFLKKFKEVLFDFPKKKVFFID